MEPEPFDETRPMPAQPGEGGTTPTPAVRPEINPLAAEDPGMSATRPNAALSGPEPAAAVISPGPAAPVSAPPPPKASGLMRLWPLFAILGLMLVGALSTFAGYNAGIDRRLSAEATQITGELQRQFDLGMEDLGARRYEVARQRFEFVLQNAPGFPGAVDGLTQAMLGLNATMTPTVRPTPTITPTPDTRGVDTLFAQAQTALQAKDWNTAIDTLLALRKVDPAYNSVRVDGMLYLALRNRGVDKILLQSDLEGGTYDLALAERFGPLDGEAKNYRIWVNLYVTGASFWEIDWSQAIYYFGQIAPLAPNLRDASGWTAAQRYLIANVRYADFLAQNGEWCAAYDQYQVAFSLGADPAIEPTAQAAGDECSQGDEGESQEQPPAEVTVVPTEISPQPTAEPTASQPYP
jgi:hypothetical protein